MQQEWHLLAMLDPTNLTLFLISAIVLTITPGPDMLYVIARSLGQGRKAGIVSAAGVCAGIIFHVAAAAIGLSALLMTSALAYNLVKYAGAAYLIYLGLRTVLARQKHGSIRSVRKARLMKVFYQGILSSTLNPKLALFFLAFLPQFVSPLNGNITRQIFMLGALFVAIAIVWLVFVALLTSAAGAWLNQRSGFGRFQQWFTGSILMGLGLRLAIAEQP